MKALISFIVFLLILLLAEIATAETIVLPMPAGDGFRVIEKDPHRPAPAPKEYVWVKVAKSREELRQDVFKRRSAVEYNRQINAVNRRGLYTVRYGRRQRYYLPTQKVTPISKWKWVRKESQ